MAPVLPTADYYQILEIAQDATLDSIVQSFRRLALKLHPDRNNAADATARFQLLGEAYETLKDISKRRVYDIHYASIRTKATRPQSTPGARPPSSTPTESAQIAIIQQLKQERATKWSAVKQSLESEIFEFSRVHKRLENEIKILEDFAAAETAEKAWENSWTLYILSPVFRKPQRTEEEVLRRDRERQERQIQKDMKERRLQANKISMTKKEAQLAAAKETFEIEDRRDASKMENLNRIVQQRAAREKAERDRILAERLEKLRKQAEEDRRHREAVAMQEALRKRREQQEESERRAAVERMRREADLQRSRQNATRGYSGWQGTTSASSCVHDGWWPKIQGRTACPDCHEVWTYLLKCPRCPKMACPKCQSDIRQNRRRETPRYGASRYRETSPVPPAYEHDYHDYWD